MSQPLWNKKMQCPFCNGAFETTRLRPSALRAKEKWSDFGCLYDGHNPYFYAITACPHCLVAARNEEFEKFNAAYEPRLMEFSKKMRAAAAKPAIFGLGDATAEQAVKRHELAIACHKLRAHGEAGELAGLLIHIVWIRRINGDAEGERKALQAAVDAYKHFYEKGNKLPEKLGEPGVLYLIGELLRRLGQVREARQYYSKALSSKELEAFPNIDSLVREQMLVAKDQLEAQGGTP
jgi:uncharacterized protein (DUF2225 family)